MEHYQVVFLGGGPGGYVGALRAAQLGLSVALIEEKELGGTCLNRGCIPTKALVKSAEVMREVHRAEEFGIMASRPEVDFLRVMARKDQVVDTLAGGIGKLLKSAKVRVIKGLGEFKEPHLIRVKIAESTETVEADNVVLATGSVPAELPVPGAGLPGVMTSDEILGASLLPGRLLVIGGGVIGLEFASVFQAFGVKVTVVEMLPNILPNIDEETARRLVLLLKRSGINIFTKNSVKEIRQDGCLVVSTEDEQGAKEIQVDQVLVAAGRKPNLTGIDVVGLGLQTERGAIVVNGQMQTNLPGVYAIGDAAGGIMLAHVASAEGMAAVEHIAGRKTAMNYAAVPSVVYTHPEVASVGLTEQGMRSQGGKYKVSKFPYSANGMALALGESVGTVKLLADEQGVIIGASILGPQAGTLIHELAVAVEQKLTGEILARTIHAHPTLSETIMEAAHGLAEKPLHVV